MAQRRRALVVLVIEDDADIRSILEMYLRDQDYIVHVAENGWKALEALSHVIPDLIFCDIKMPIMNGIELSRRIKELPGLERVPLVLMTAGDPEPAALANAIWDDFLWKPFQVSELERLLSKHLGAMTEGGLTRGDSIGTGGDAELRDSAGGDARS